MDNSRVNVILANPPTETGDLVIREGRCSQSAGLWTTVWPPLTLATMGAFLEQSRHMVKILDCPVEMIDVRRFLEIVASFEPQLVILNVSTPTFAFDMKLCKMLKNARPALVIGVMGTHVSALPAEALMGYRDVDLVIMGEPELTVLEISERIASSNPLDHVPGTAVRSETEPDMNPIRINPPRPFLDPQELPVPAWHLVQLDRYRLPIYRRKFLLLASGRGCPFCCSFCTAQTFYGSKLRMRDPETVVDEMFFIASQFGVSDFLFWTETFTLRPDHVREMCRMIIARGGGVRWTCNSRVDAVDWDTFRLMKEAGCWMVSFGIESASQSVLDTAGKRIHLDDIHHAVYLARRAGLQITGHFILGLPGETPESLKKTISLAIRLDLDYAQFYCAAPFPGSRLFIDADSSGWIRDREYSHFDQTVANLNLPGLTAEEVQRIRSQAIRRFYLRPGRIFRTLSRIRSYSELLNMLRMFFSFAKNLSW